MGGHGWHVAGVGVFDQGSVVLKILKSGEPEAEDTFVIISPSNASLSPYVWGQCC